MCNFAHICVSHIVLWELHGGSSLCFPSHQQPCFYFIAIELAPLQHNPSHSEPTRPRSLALVLLFIRPEHILEVCSRGSRDRSGLIGVSSNPDRPERMPQEDGFRRKVDIADGVRCGVDKEEEQLGELLGVGVIKLRTRVGFERHQRETFDRATNPQFNPYVCNAQSTCKRAHLRASVVSRTLIHLMMMIMKDDSSANDEFPPQISSMTR